MRPGSHILVPVDPAFGFRRSLRLAEGMRPFFGRRITLLRAADPDGLLRHVAATDRPDFIAAAARSLAERVRRVAPRLARAVDPVVRLGEPAEVIVDEARGPQVGLVVMLTHGWRGVERLVHGCVAERVCREARRPLLTLRAGAHDGGGRRDAPPFRPRSILVATDLAPCSRRALDLALDLVARWQADLFLVHAVRQGRSAAGAPDRELAEMQALIQRWVPSVRVQAALAPGDPVGAIVGLARAERVELIVSGSHRGRGALRELLAGGIAREVSRRAPCPVLIVPEEPEPTVGGEPARARGAEPAAAAGGA